MEKLRLMASWEIQQRLGVGRHRVYQIVNRKGFPDPIAEVHVAKLWLADDVEAWIAENRPELGEDSEGG